MNNINNINVNFIIIFISMVFIIVAFFIIYFKKVYISKQHLEATLYEAQQLKSDLEELMTSSINFSQSFLAEIDEKVNLPQDTVLSQDSDHKNSDSENNEPPEIKEKMRVYELAKYYDITSREMLDIINNLGINIKSHMQMIDSPNINIIKNNMLAREKRKQINPENSLHNNENNGISTSDCRQNNNDVYPIPNPALQNDSILKAAAAIEDDYFGKARININQIRQTHPYIAVKTLMEKGYSVNEIAQLLNRGQGEINLIIKILHKKTVSM